MKRIILLLLLLISKFSFCQIKNGSFEIWDTVYTGAYSGELNSYFGVPNPLAGLVHNWSASTYSGISRTTDSHSGNYSLIVHNWYSYVNQQITYKDSISSRPKYLQGYYKYRTGGVDGQGNGMAKVTLTHFNGFVNDTIATSVFIFDSTNYFMPFQMTLNYVSILTPDSINITIRNADKPCNWDSSADVCHLLYLDDLTLTNTPLAVEDINLDGTDLTIYPNPLSNELRIQNNLNQPFLFTLYSSLGEKIMSESLKDNTSIINLSRCLNGIYFYELTSDNMLLKRGKIIKQ